MTVQELRRLVKQRTSTVLEVRDDLEKFSLADLDHVTGGMISRNPKWAAEYEKIMQEQSEKENENDCKENDSS